MANPFEYSLLNRRSFLGDFAKTTAGIALASLLADQGLLAVVEASGSDRPLAPRPPHFSAKAKRVLHVFCTGAVSHLDTWDYKPELLKRHGQPMPGMDKLVTFQGENGNLTRSPWKFRCVRLLTRSRQVFVACASVRKRPPRMLR